MTSEDDRAMWIEITGGGVHNKGALLMLQTVIRAFAERFPDCRFAVEPRAAGDFALRGREGLHQITPFWFGRSRLAYRLANCGFGMLYRLLPAYYRRHYGMVRRSQCNGQVDISGLAFCYLFPACYASDAAAMIRRYYAGRSPVIFLPQMVGPLSTEAHRPVSSRK